MPTDKPEPDLGHAIELIKTHQRWRGHTVADCRDLEAALAFLERLPRVVAELERLRDVHHKRELRGDTFRHFHDGKAEAFRIAAELLRGEVADGDGGER